MKEHASSILRDVRETGEIVEITHRGQVVARLVPAGTASSAAVKEKTAAVLADLDELAAEIAKYWPKGVSAVDAVREQRREL